MGGTWAWDWVGTLGRQGCDLHVCRWLVGTALGQVRGMSCTDAETYSDLGVSGVVSQHGTSGWDWRALGGVGVAGVVAADGREASAASVHE